MRISDWSSDVCSSDLDASALYARNIYNFIELLVDKGSKQLAVNWEDKIVADTCIIRDGKIVHPALAPQEATPPEAASPEAASPEAASPPPATDHPSDEKEG